MSLMHETMADAIREVVMAAGGFKAVGCLMFPDAPADHAAGNLRDRLNSGRRELFGPDQVMLLVRIGRQHGCHAIMQFMAREAGYADPTPIDPEDEVARLQREFISATKALGAMATRIETISAHAARRVA